jgi:hypothetical protein
MVWGKVDCGPQFDDFSMSSCSCFEIPPYSELYLLLPQAVDFRLNLILASCNENEEGILQFMSFFFLKIILREFFAIESSQYGEKAIPVEERVHFN